MHWKAGVSGMGWLSQERRWWHNRLMKHFLVGAALLAAPAALFAADPAPLAPAEIVAQAPAADWTAIDAYDLLVMDLAPDASGKTRRVVIQLMPPPFSQGWIGNIRKLAAAHWWDDTSVNRVQDNYVVQWGDAEAEDKAKAKPLLEGLTAIPQERYLTPVTYQILRSAQGMAHFNFPNPWPISKRDGYADAVAFWRGWPLAGTRSDDTHGEVELPADRPNLYWPIHCYGMIGVGRAMPPDTGSGAELYAVIGTPPRHLDRNIALVGRVIEGIEHLSSLPRGTGQLGFYAKAEERVPIRAIRLGKEVPGLPAYQYLSTESASFARYADARANRRDPFFIRPAGGADICNVPVPIRRAPR